MSETRSIGLGERVEVVLELPAWSFIRRSPDGRIVLISPVPTPFAYGFVPGVLAGDGAPRDALVLDQRGRRGARIGTTVQGIVRWVDNGQEDDKLICAEQPVGPLGRAAVLGYLGLYAIAKRMLYRARGIDGDTKLRGASWARPSVGLDDRDPYL